MASAQPLPLQPVRSAPRSAAQTRVLTAALDLFAEHGVSGTSLQMIADAIGVTKAAVYHQFKTKDEIVRAVAEVELEKVAATLAAAEAESFRPRALERLITQVIDYAVTHRRMVSMLQSDPVMVRFLSQHDPFRQLMERLFRVLVGDDAGVDARLPAAMMSAALGGAVGHPLVVDLDDDTLRAQLRILARRLLDLPG